MPIVTCVVEIVIKETTTGWLLFAAHALTVKLIEHFNVKPRLFFSRQQKITTPSLAYFLHLARPQQ